MAQITYRGVKYNAEQYKAKVLAEQDQRRNHELCIVVSKLIANSHPRARDHGSTTSRRWNLHRRVAFLFLIVGEVHLLKVSRG